MKNEKLFVIGLEPATQARPRRGAISNDILFISYLSSGK